MSVCPNKNMQDYKVLVDKIGIDGAFHAFMKNGNKVPYLQDRGSNRLVWNVENNKGILEWVRDSETKTNTKVPKQLSEDDATRITSEIRAEYVGDYSVRHITDQEGHHTVRVSGYPVPKAEVREYMSKYGKDEKTAARSVAKLTMLNYVEENGDASIVPLESDFKLFEGITTAELESYSLADYANENVPFEQKDDSGQLAETFIKNKINRRVKDLNITNNNEIKSLGELSHGGLVINTYALLNLKGGRELGQLLVDVRGGVSSRFIQEGLELLKNEKWAQELAEKNKTLTKESLNRLIMATALNKFTGAVQDATAKEQWNKWLLKMTRWMGSKTGLTKKDMAILSDVQLTNELEKASELPTKNPEIDKHFERVIDILQADSTKLQKLRAKAYDITSTRIRKATATGRSETVEELYDVLDAIENEENSDIVAVKGFIANAVSYINSLYSSYEERLRLEKLGKKSAFKLSTLNRWHDILSSYDLLDEMSSELLNTASKGLTRSELSTVRKYLKDAVEKKNTLRDLYKNKGADMLTEVLSRYNSHIVIEMRRTKRREWVKNNNTKGMSLEDVKKKSDEYANEYIAKNIDYLTELGNKMLRAEMETATGDISVLGRWLDTILNTDDMMMAAMVKKFVVKHGESRAATIDFKNDAWNLVQELYKDANYKYLKTDPYEVYKFMLETDSNGKPTGYLATKYKSGLMAAYRSMLKETESLTQKERSKKRNTWVKENMPQDDVAWKKGYMQYLEELREDDEISEDEMSELILVSDMNYYARPKLSDIVNAEAASLVYKWMTDNFMTYRNPSDKWLNKKEWPALEKELKEGTSTKAKFYKLISDKMSEIDSQVPFSKRKHGQLPFKLKEMDERVAAGQAPKSVLKESIKDAKERRVDEVERGQYTDENDKPINYVPWYYDRPDSGSYHIFEYTETSATGVESKPIKVRIKAENGEEAVAKFERTHPDVKNFKVSFDKAVEWTTEDQSYDLMGLFYNYVKMANNYINMIDVLPEMELVHRLANDRKYVDNDPNGNPKIKNVSAKVSRVLTKEGSKAHIADQFEDFMKSMLYGQHKEEESEFNFLGMKFDRAKMIDALGTFSSFNMLGFNLIQGISNINVGEITQVTEALAGEYFNMKDLHYATTEWGKNLQDSMSDIGLNSPESKIGRMVEKWDILNEYEGGDYKRNSRFSNLMRTSSAFFMANIGEHFLQSRVMIAMLRNVEAKNSKGEVIGNMYEMYEVRDGKLKLKPEVDLEQSEWSQEEQDLFGAKVKRLLALLHGEYSQIGKNSAQRWAVGRAAMMFRKFIVPGIRRRWSGERINTFLNDYTSGSYIAVGKFLFNSIKEFKVYKFAAMSENWNVLTAQERANIIRGASELGFAVSLAIFASIALALKGEVDDDDYVQRKALATVAVLALRAKTESLFYLLPSEALTIMKNPAVSVSTLESILRLLYEVADPMDVYERGSWEGYPKFLKQLINLTPGVKQAYKIKNIEDTLTFYN